MVEGMTSSRSVASAASDAASVPSPCIGMLTMATWWSGLMRVLTGPDIWSVASALVVRSLMPA